MKLFNKKLLAVCCGLLSFFVSANNDFDPLSLSGYKSSNAVSSVMLSVVDKDKQLFMVGERGIIIRSDKGEKWTQDQVPVSTTLTKVIALDKGLLALGHSGTILRLKDLSSNSWDVVLNGLDIPKIYQDYIDHALLSADNKRILEREVEGYILQGPDKPFFNAIEIEKGRVQVFGAYGLALELVEKNGDFKAEPITHRFSDTDYMHLYGAARHDGVIYVVGEQGTLYSSNDNGLHYKPIDSPYKGTFFGVSELAGELYIYGMNGNIYRQLQNDGWVKVSIKSEASVADMTTSKGKVYVLTQSGEIFSSCETVCEMNLRVNSPSAGFVLREDRAFLSTFSGPQSVK